MHLSFPTIVLHPADIMQSDFITLRMCTEEYNYETHYEVPSVPFYCHIIYYLPYHPIFGRDMD
jgi:hypothetical protein